MSVRLLTYDLVKKKPEFDYQILWDELERLGAHRVQESVWLVATTSTVKETFDHFENFVHADDRLWVSSVRKDQYWFKNAKAGTNAWLKENPPG